MRRLTGARAGTACRQPNCGWARPWPPTPCSNAREPTLLAITRGFGDALRIGTQERPDIFARKIDLPVPLFAQAVEIDERVMPPMARCWPRWMKIAPAPRCNPRSIAGCVPSRSCLMHGWKYPAHEAALARIAAEVGFGQISVSHRVAPLIKLVARGDTTVVDAYLSPVLRRYVAGLEAGLGPAVAALYMQSSGGLAAARRSMGKTPCSGPAGGIVGMAATAKAAGFAQVVGFDMGGTSTDVSYYAGSYEREVEARVAGSRIRAPMMRIHTVAAGGGSICRFDGTRFLVGPDRPARCRGRRVTGAAVRSR
jgi:5-oxoprolinase (ATP-hydrolysing)